jgi:hypothetical protein
MCLIADVPDTLQGSDIGKYSDNPQPNIKLIENK